MQKEFKNLAGYQPSHLVSGRVLPAQYGRLGIDSIYVGSIINDDGAILSDILSHEQGYIFLTHAVERGQINPDQATKIEIQIKNDDKLTGHFSRLETVLKTDDDGIVYAELFDALNKVAPVRSKDDAQFCLEKGIEIGVIHKSRKSRIERQIELSNLPQTVARFEDNKVFHRNGDFCDTFGNRDLATLIAKATLDKNEISVSDFDRISAQIAEANLDDKPFYDLPMGEDEQGPYLTIKLKFGDNEDPPKFHSKDAVTLSMNAAVGAAVGAEILLPKHMDHMKTVAEKSNLPQTLVGIEHCNRDNYHVLDANGAHDLGHIKSKKQAIVKFDQYVTKNLVTPESKAAFEDKLAKTIGLPDTHESDEFFDSKNAFAAELSKLVGGDISIELLTLLSGR